MEQHSPVSVPVPELNVGLLAGALTVLKILVALTVADSVLREVAGRLDADSEAEIDGSVDRDAEAVESDESDRDDKDADGGVESDENDRDDSVEREGAADETIETLGLADGEIDTEITVWEAGAETLDAIDELATDIDGKSDETIVTCEDDGAAPATGRGSNPPRQGKTSRRAASFRGPDIFRLRERPRRLEILGPFPAEQGLGDPQRTTGTPPLSTSVGPSRVHLTSMNRHHGPLHFCPRFFPTLALA